MRMGRQRDLREMHIDAETIRCSHPIDKHALCQPREDVHGMIVDV